MIDLVETETDRRYVLFFKLLKYQFISHEYGHLKCIYTIRRGQILVALKLSFAKWVKQLKVFQNLTSLEYSNQVTNFSSTLERVHLLG